MFGLKNGRVYVSRHVVFYELDFPLRNKSAGSLLGPTQQQLRTNHMDENMQQPFSNSNSPATSQPNIAVAQNSIEIHNPNIKQTTPTQNLIPTPNPPTPTTPTTIPGDHQYTCVGQTSQLNLNPDASSSPATPTSSSPKVQKFTPEVCTPSPAIPASSSITHPAPESPDSLNSTLKIRSLADIYQKTSPHPLPHGLIATKLDDVFSEP
ncbi:uncharacterized protein LOC111914423 [Lactuca sativa]|uniref:uncharacterized protein LOC111914423 n=1 Tax=Lactuca sativa TaxID=4236 RepID=UPI000CD8467A|nr:uncharacterized protein LOC111914423 [Lactuca sativa]